MINQLSVFVENKFGRLSAVLKALADSDIDISALSLADSSEFGVLRLIVSDTEKAAAALRAEGVMVKSSPVIAASMADRPGGLASITELFKSEGISIDYMYAFIGKRDDMAWAVFKVTDSAKAVAALESAGVQMLSNADIIK